MSRRNEREGLTARFGEQFRRYLRDMGVETELLDIVDRNSGNPAPDRNAAIRMDSAAHRHVSGDVAPVKAGAFLKQAAGLSDLEQPEIAQFAPHRFRHRATLAAADLVRSGGAASSAR
jgi:hypothetical protein